MEVGSVSWPEALLDAGPVAQFHWHRGVDLRIGGKELFRAAMIEFFSNGKVHEGIH